MTRDRTAAATFLLGATAAGWYACGDWIGGAAVFVLILVWKLLAVPRAPLILAWALSFQWLQVTIGLFYAGLTGRILRTVIRSDYRPMVLMGLGCVLALAIGLRAGIWLVLRLRGRRNTASPAPLELSWPLLIVSYAVAFALNGTLLSAAPAYPSLTQAIYAIAMLRLGILFLILRRLISPRFRPWYFAGLLGLEILLGFSGFFASFKDPLVIAVVAIFEAFDRRRFAHWAAALTLIAVAVSTGVTWLAVRKTYRADYAHLNTRMARVERIGELVDTWWQQNTGNVMDSLDPLVDRLWAVYYPALALKRVPAVVPHTDGALLEAAVVQALEPRIFFPNKPVLQSDSELVRRYSGVYVAGAESNTSIAFGYAAESYIDFGVRGMFVPVFLFGLLMGIAFAGFLVLIRHPELSSALVTVVFWLSLYLFEKSWPYLIGQAGAMIVYLGGATFLIDRYLSRRRRERLLATPGRDQATWSLGSPR